MSARHTLIYGPSDVADELGISRQNMSNMLARHAESMPAPSHVTPDGRRFWNARGLAAWRRFHAGIVDGA